VIIPNIMPGIINGCLLVFSTVFSNHPTNLLVGTRSAFPIYLVEFTRQTAARPAPWQSSVLS
jgi:ABC-type spermidine/putrescine transport system permease subunit II